LAIALAQMWPELRIVGIDPWQPSLALARENVEAANLGDRIELREQVGEAIDDVDAFDLAWLPFPFVPERAIGPTCERTLRALRPGGWIIVSMSGHGALEPLPAAAMRLRLTLCGGPDWTSAQAESLLRDQGYVDVRTLAHAPGSVLCNVVGRRR
jgi:SAM-dependent methyltransferase